MPPPSNNLALLTQSHTAIAAKRRTRNSQITEIIFDEEARREFLTGFHKRKVARADAAKKKALDRQKQEQREARNEQRRVLRERAEENAAQIESVYNEILDNHDDEEWTGICASDSEQRNETGHEYEGEEQLATVTIVEDFDLDHPKPKDVRKQSPEESRILPTKIPTKRKEKTGSKKVRYLTQQERKKDRLKQRARRAEKAGASGRIKNKRDPRNK